MELRERRDEKDGGTQRTPQKKPGADDTGKKKIRCPQCGWKHDWKAHWGCELCGSIFDTFVTRANCPDATCKNSWKLTWCPKCHEPSPHEDWYVKESGGRES